MNKLIALLSYLSWPGWIVAVFLFSVEKEKNAYARFHLRQSFGLALFALAFYIASRVFDFYLFNFSITSLAVFIVFFVLWFIGFKSAMDETQRPLPVIGRYFQKWFTFL
ncbi:MAG TPA: hypothetical protein VGM41_15395 [Chitinophagaceae bacterium]|jgi:uncharacterized membrane protein